MQTIFEWGGVSIVILVVAFSWALLRIASDSEHIEARLHPDELKRLEQAAKWRAAHDKRRAS